MAGYDDDLRFAHVLADSADDITTRRFRALDLRVEAKPDLTPVTDADRAAEESLRNVLRRARPRDAVLGEEFGRAGASPRCWVIDPIDATKNFVRGIPVWATLIGLMDGNEVTVGVVSAPALGRRWWAARGGGAWTGRSLTKASRETNPGRQQATARQPGPAARSRAGARPLAASLPPSGGGPRRPPRTTSRPAPIRPRAGPPLPLAWIRSPRPGPVPLNPRPVCRGQLAIQPASPVMAARTSAPREPARTDPQSHAAVCSGRCRGWPGRAQPGRTWLDPAEPGRLAPDRARLGRGRAGPAGAGPPSQPLAWPA